MTAKRGGFVGVCYAYRHPKRQYLSRKEARRAQVPGRSLHAYLCEECDYFHNGRLSASYGVRVATSDG